ncbi:MAG: CPBP family intramembrane metalloprotease, partial [Deltaproteobacteria bacterium]|nr:CPBP family intramembrane metalloprotease [Deltaproteobacteria bacterium]
TLILGHLSFKIPAVGTLRLIEIVLMLLIVVIWGRGLSSIGLARNQIVPGLKKGLIWSAGFGLIAVFCFTVIYAAGSNPLRLLQTPLPSKSWQAGLFFLVGGTVAPLAEELFFRGIVYGFLRRWGVIVALAASTLLFVLAHAGGPGLPLMQIAGGIMFALAYELEGHLLVPVVIHALGNMAIFSLTLLS